MHKYKYFYATKLKQPNQKSIMALSALHSFYVILKALFCFGFSILTTNQNDYLVLNCFNVK